MKDKKKIKMPKRASIISLAALAVLLAVLVILGTFLVTKGRDGNKLKTESGTKMNEEVMSELDDIDIYLSTLEKGVADNKATLDTIQNSKETSKLEKEIDDQKTILSGIFEKIAGIGENVSSNKTDIGELTAAMDSNSRGILGSVSSYFLNLKSSIDKLSGDSSNIFAELASKLDTLGGNDETLKSEINSKYESLDRNINSRLDSVSESIKNVDNSFNNRFDTFNTEIGATIMADTESLNSYIQAAFEGVNGKIDQVFTYASSGKNLLASTLSGYPDAYRVETNADAPFGTIKNNIDTAIELAINYGKSLSESSDNVILVPSGADLTIYAHFCSSSEEDHTKTFKSWSEYQDYYNAHSNLDNSMSGGCFAESQHTEYMSTGTKICGTYECIYNGSGAGFAKFRCTGCGNEVVKEVVITGPGWGMGDHYVETYDYVPMGYYDTVCGYHNGQITKIEVNY